MATEGRAADGRNWRALAVTHEGEEVLVCLGKSARQVKDDYEQAYYTNLHSTVRGRVVLVRLERWRGNDESGLWLVRDHLTVPTT